ncbi:MAG: hypothetical protein PHG85_02295 [Candidatus Altiarchaeota archaeon]|nr:hypothetical protein [Candidatus Altiarchaeota archaeon]
MLDKKDFAGIKKELDQNHELSESLYRQSRDLVGTTKKLIFALHRGSLGDAEKLVPDMEKLKKKMEDGVKKSGSFKSHNAYTIAMQEYTEAAAYLHFVKNNKIPTRSQLKVPAEEYVSGLCDLSGELVRKAVDLSIKGDSKGVGAIKNFAEDFYGMLLELNPYGELRKKADQARWNLNKLEDLVYEGTLRRR